MRAICCQDTEAMVTTAGGVRRGRAAQLWTKYHPRQGTDACLTDQSYTPTASGPMTGSCTAERDVDTRSLRSAIVLRTLEQVWSSGYDVSLTR